MNEKLLGSLLVLSISCGCAGENVKDAPLSPGDRCTPSVFRTVCEGNSVKSCADSGIIIKTPCPNGCSNSQCIQVTPFPTGEACNPADYKPFCDNGNLKTCSSDGKVLSTPCAYGCSNNACQSEPVETCSPNSYKDVCDGSRVKSCSTEGRIVLTPCLKSCSDGVCIDTYKTRENAPSLAGSDMKSHLGPVITDGGVQFAVFSANALRVETLLFKDGTSDRPLARIPMTKGKDDIWTLFVEGIGEGQHYGYIAFGPNWTYDPDFDAGSTKGFVTDVDHNGNRFNPNKLLIDPYARRLSGDFDASKGSPNTGEKSRAVSTWGAAPKSVVATSKYIWSENEQSWRANRQKGDAFEGHAANDLIYYEAHPKGLTKNATQIKSLGLTISAPGTYRGIGEMAPYFKDLGINVLELLPVFEKQDSDSYWGYSSFNFFTPDANYSSRSDAPGDVIDEFKWMVDQLHQNGIEIVIDVAYSQTNEAGIAKTQYKQGQGVKCPDEENSLYTYEYDHTVTALYSFRGLDNASYYILEDFFGKREAGDGCEEFKIDRAGYLNQTGNGNQTRTNHGPFKQLILDSIHFWVEEMHIDGFRFVQASILGVLENDRYADLPVWFNTVSKTVIQELIDDPVLQRHNTRMVAEPWDRARFGLGGCTKSKNKPGYAWSEWNATFRSFMKRFVNFDNVVLNSTGITPPHVESNIDFGNLMLGSSVLFGDDGRSPYNSVNQLASHDGFTLYDVVTYIQSLNGCGLLNPVCCTNETECDHLDGIDINDSRNWCVTGYDDEQTHRNEWGRCDKESNESLKRQMIRNLFSLLLLTNGSPMINGGDEIMRTLYGNDNPHGATSDNKYNWLRWDDWQKNDEAVRMHSFVKHLIRIRKRYREALAPASYGVNVPVWRWHDGNAPIWSEKTLGIYYKQHSDTPSLFIMINMETNLERTFKLPEEGEWKVLVDTQQYFDDGIFVDKPETDRRVSHNASSNSLYTTSGDYTLKPRTIVVISK